MVAGDDDSLAIFSILSTINSSEIVLIFCESAVQYWGSRQEDKYFTKMLRTLFAHNPDPMLLVFPLSDPQIRKRSQ